MHDRGHLILLEDYKCGFFSFSNQLCKRFDMIVLISDGRFVGCLFFASSYFEYNKIRMLKIARKFIHYSVLLFFHGKVLEVIGLYLLVDI